MEIKLKNIFIFTCKIHKHTGWTWICALKLIVLFYGVENVQHYQSCGEEIKAILSLSVCACAGIVSTQHCFFKSLKGTFSFLFHLPISTKAAFLFHSSKLSLFTFLLDFLSSFLSFSPPSYSSYSPPHPSSLSPYAPFPATLSPPGLNRLHHWSGFLFQERPACKIIRGADAKGVL